MAKVRNNAGKAVRGRSIVYEFVNDDAPSYGSTCCGQAACATVAWTLEPSRITDFKALVKTHPPDNFFGMLGSSYWRIGETLNGLGVHYSMQYGVDQLRKLVAARYPCIALVDVGRTTWAGGLTVGMGLHWTVVYGFSASHYFVSNFTAQHEKENYCGRAIFEEAMDTGLTWLAGSRGQQCFACH